MHPSLAIALAFAASALAQKPAFVEIPAGSFVMGCDPALACSETLPKQRVAFDRPFQLAKYEVTVGEFRAFVKGTGYRSDAEKAGDVETWQSPGFPLGNQQPVVFMSFNDAKAYCESIGGRVPLEAEWEYAARAGATTHHYWGEEIDDRYLWYFSNTDQRPDAGGPQTAERLGSLSTWKATPWNGYAAEGRTPASRGPIPDRLAVDPTLPALSLIR